MVCGLRTCLIILAHHMIDRLTKCWTCAQVSGRGSWLSTGQRGAARSVVQGYLGAVAGDAKWVSSTWTVTIFRA